MFRLVSTFEDKILHYSPEKDLKKYGALSYLCAGNFTKFADYVIQSGRDCQLGRDCLEVDALWRPFHPK